MNGFLTGETTKIVVETDEQNPKTIAIITDDGSEFLADGYRVRYTLKYEKK